MEVVAKERSFNETVFYVKISKRKTCLFLKTIFFRKREFQNILRKTDDFMEEAEKKGKKIKLFTFS